MTTPTTPLCTSNKCASRITDRTKAATRHPAQGCWTNSPCPPGHNTPAPLERSPPASFKRLLGSSIAIKTSGRVGPRGHPALAGRGHSGSSEQPGRARGNRAVLAWHRVHHEAPRLPDQAAQHWEGGVQVV